MKPTNFAKHLSQYLSVYLPGIAGLSTNTIASRRDCFMLLLQYLRDVKGITPEKTDMPVLTPELITMYLDWLELERHCSVSTRNLRLSALKAFFRYLQIQTPDYMHQYQQIAALPLKKKPERGLEYLSLAGVETLLQTIHADTKNGLRDLTLISTLYDSAARVQEIVDLRIQDIRLNKPATLRLTGKGRKTRIIPIMEPTARLIESYLRRVHVAADDSNFPMFYNRSGRKLTRAGITYVLSKYVEALRATKPELVPKSVSPHALRHSKSAHMLTAGVPLIYIRDYLGHVEISTTEVYAKCDTSQKRQAIEKVSSPAGSQEVPLWQTDSSLMKWLRSLC
jgi:site-specific recombinase XerD